MSAPTAPPAFVIGFSVVTFSPTGGLTIQGQLKDHHRAVRLCDRTNGALTRAYPDKSTRPRAVVTPVYASTAAARDALWGTTSYSHKRAPVSS